MAFIITAILSIILILQPYNNDKILAEASCCGCCGCCQPCCSCCTPCCNPPLLIKLPRTCPCCCCCKPCCCCCCGGGGGGRKKREVGAGSGGVMFPRAVFPKVASVPTLSEGCGSINCNACNDVAGGLRRRRRSIVENKFACSSGLLNSMPCKRAALANLKPESMSDRINPRFGFKAGFSSKC